MGSPDAGRRLAAHRRLVAGQIVGVVFFAVAIWQILGGWHALAAFGVGLFTICQILDPGPPDAIGRPWRAGTATVGTGGRRRR